jgi:hypothetical protein
MTQNNLGAALRTLGQRMKSRPMRESAILGIEDALAVFRDAHHAPYVSIAETNLSIARAAPDGLGRS